jgi:hypothetical protein
MWWRLLPSMMKRRFYGVRVTSHIVKTRVVSSMMPLRIFKEEKTT